VECGFNMINKSVSVALFICIVPFLMATTCFGGSLPKELLSKNFLRKYSWESSEQINQILENWPNFTGDQSGDKGLKDRKFLKKAVIDIEGISYDGSLRKYNKSGNYEVVLVNGSSREYKATPQNLDYCNRLIKKYSATFGRPSNLVDLSEDPSKDWATIKQNAYWDVNNSRVNVACTTIKVFQGFIPLIFVHYGNKRDVKQVYDAVFLKCTRTKKGMGRFAKFGTSEEPPFTLTIDQNSKSLKSKNIRLGKTISYNNEEIVTLLDEKKKNIKADFKLDRYSGSYVWEITITDKTFGTGSGYKFWGDCSKIKREKKF